MTILKWGASASAGTPGGTVTWSVVGAGARDSTMLSDGSGGRVAFFTGATVSLSTLTADYVALLSSAFAAWSAVANIDFQFVADGGGNFGVGANANIRIGAAYIDGDGRYDTVGQAIFPSTGSSAARAQNGDIIFDSGNAWDSAMFYQVALHEIGHALGLDHTADASAVMYPSVNGLTTLQPDDIAAIQAIYGARETVTADDYAAGVSTTGVVAAGGSVTGVIELAGDEDWFVVRLNAGVEYAFNLVGISLADPLLRLYGPSGALLIERDDSNGGLDPEIIFTATATADYYLGASGFESNSGGYQLQVMRIGGGLFTDFGETVYLPTAGRTWNAFGGDDTVIGTQGRDIVVGDAGDDRLLLSGGDDVATGNAGRDEMSGGDGADMLLGDAGDDLINGGDGVDSLSGGDGNDVIYGDDPSSAAGGGDAIDGGVGSDALRGFAGDDTIYGGAGDDVATGDDGHDMINGQDGADYLHGNDGDDMINGGAGADVLSGNAGNDVIYGDDSDAATGGADAIDGGDGHDVLLGFGGNDMIYGGKGNDYLVGNAGNDTLRAQEGFDYLNGGAGIDSFLFDQRGFQQDEIQDFQNGIDRLIFTSSVFGSFAEVRSAAFQQGSYTFIYAGGGDYVVLANFDVRHLTADDVIIA